MYMYVTKICFEKNSFFEKEEREYWRINDMKDKNVRRKCSVYT